jgi:hypothetical protein
VIDRVGIGASKDKRALSWDNWGTGTGASTPATPAITQLDFHLAEGARLP